MNTYYEKGMVMSMENKEWSREKQHFDECRDLIAGNIELYEKEAEERHREVQELYKAVQAGDGELYNQLLTSTSLEEHANNQLRKNKAAFEKPYFGRIDYKDLRLEKEEKVYIGKNGVFRDKTEVVIADWRAPIATVYYENEMGEGSYETPDGKEQPINLQLKRTYDVEKGVLRGFYDSDVASNDELLVQYLSKNKDAVLGDIIATIQKEQNEIIRANPFSNTIVQGVAGSEKTTVAMHRISYILYNYKERFTSNEFCIIGSNDMLLNYITSGLPELDVFDMKQKRMDDMFIHLLEKDFKAKFKKTNVGRDGEWKSKMQFMKGLERYLERIRESCIPCEELVDDELGRVMSSSGIKEIMESFPEYSVNRLLALLDERLKNRLKFLIDDSDKEDYRKKLTEKSAQYKRYYQNKKIVKSPVDIYLEFLKDYGKRTRTETDETVGQIFENKFDVYDLAALVLIRYRTTQKKEDEEFGQIFIDEAQDFGVTPYYVLRKVLPKCFFTIMGDVSQNINYESGMNDWEDLKKCMLTNEKDSFRLLSKSYRNTIEISEYAGKILELASAGAYKIEPVIRHGMQVDIEESGTDKERAKKAADIIEAVKLRGFASIAIVVFDEAESAVVKNEVGAYTELIDGNETGFQTGTMVLPVQLTKGLEFDAVILWKPQMEQAKTSSKEAKLRYVAVTRALHELHILN